MISATFGSKVAQRAAKRLLHNPIRITAGKIGAAYINVCQLVVRVKNDADRHTKLLELLGKEHTEAAATQTTTKIIVFVNTRCKAEKVAVDLHSSGWPCAADLRGCVPF